MYSFTVCMSRDLADKIEEELRKNDLSRAALIRKIVKFYFEHERKLQKSEVA